MSDLKIENLKEYRPDGPDGVYAADFEYVCPNCGERHTESVRQTEVIHVVTVKGWCGFRAPVALPMLEREDRKAG